MAMLKQIGIDVQIHRAIETARRSFSESENDILRRLLFAPAPELPSSSAPALTVERTRGLWTVRVDGAVQSARNLKDAYCRFVAALASRDDSFLSSFSEEKSRARRFVARTPDELYRKSPHLARDHAVEFLPGWFIDTNLSEEQAAKRIKIAARIAGLPYGAKTCVLKELKQL